MNSPPYRYLTVDGELGGTGLRDSLEGKELSPSDIGCSNALSRKFENWLRRYELEHYNEFRNVKTLEKLDQEGISICKSLMADLPAIKVTYYSHGLAKALWFKNPT